MAIDIRRVDYYYTTLKDRPGEAYKLLSQLRDLGVNLYAFNAVPEGLIRTQLTLFPEVTYELENAAKEMEIRINGPYPAFLIQGHDEIGALVHLHERLFLANVNVYGASAVVSGEGRYGYIIYISPEEFDRAEEVLDILQEDMVVEY